MDRLTLATIWLGGCSGCHMSFLDMDEWLIALAERVEVVYSPFADVKTYPDNVHVALIEGAIANDDHLKLIQQARRCTDLLIAFGDCAVTGNVTALRNPLSSVQDILQYVYVEASDIENTPPDEAGIVPPLLDRVVPVHAVVPVDVYLPGCPPPADRIRAVLERLLVGESLQLTGRELIKFG